MIELRWIWSRDTIAGISQPLILQSRFMQYSSDASGALSVIGAVWSDWQDVPTAQEIASNVAQEGGNGEG